MLSRFAVITFGVIFALLLVVRFAASPFVQTPEVQTPSIRPEYWTFNTQQHRKLHTLSEAQCDAAFPKLYDRIENAVSGYKGRQRRITYEDVTIERGRCMVQVLIFDGALYITDLGDHLECYVSNGRERIVATLNLIYRAVVSSPYHVPNIEFPLSYDDLPTRSTHKVVWGYTRREDEDSVWLLPDYGYWSWWAVGIQSFESLSRDIAAVDEGLAWSQKTPKAVWRGTTHYAPEIRGGLLEVTKDKSWADVQQLVMDGDRANFLSLDDHCRYQYLFQTEGTSYTGRFKFLQLCNSVIIAHKLAYAEFATHLLEPAGPEQNFVEVERDWSDLAVKMDYLIKDPNNAAAIASRGHKVFAQRYLTPAAVSCYIRRMIQGWAGVQAFEPALYENDRTTGKLKLRGIPFEAFAVSFPQDKPGEYGRFAQGS